MFSYVRCFTICSNVQVSSTSSTSRVIEGPLRHSKLLSNDVMCLLDENLIDISWFFNPINAVSHRFGRCFLGLMNNLITKVVISFVFYIDIF